MVQDKEKVHRFLHQGKPRVGHSVKLGKSSRYYQIWFGIINELLSKWTKNLSVILILFVHKFHALFIAIKISK